MECYEYAVRFHFDFDLAFLWGSAAVTGRSESPSVSCKDTGEGIATCHMSNDALA